MTPAFAHAGQRAREILCTVECEREHVAATYEAARHAEGATTAFEADAVRKYADTGRLRAIRGTVTEEAIELLRVGNTGGSWDAFAGMVADNSMVRIDLGALFGILWPFVRAIVGAAFRAFVWWAIRYFVRLAIEDVKRKLFGATLDQYGDLPPEQAVAMWGA